MDEFDIPKDTKPLDDEIFDLGDKPSPVRTGGESILEKPLINTFFDPEQMLLTPVEKTMKGFQKIDGEWVYSSRPLARTAFINNMINMMRSVINTINFNSKLTSKQIDNILLEKNIEFIEMCKLEPKWSLDDENVEMVVNIFDHSLQMYMGVVENGRITDVITQIATGSYNMDAFKNINKSNESLLGGFNIFRK